MYTALLLPTRPEQKLPPTPADTTLSWPADAVQLLHEQFRQRGDAELARLLQGRFGYAYDSRQVEHRRQVYGLHRTPQEIEAIRQHTRQQAPPRRARRAQPEGAEQVRVEAGPNGPRPRRMVKSNGRSKPLAVRNYEEAYGPVPAGHIVTFRDGNPLNCEPGNLLLLTRAENADRNRNKGKAIEKLRAHHAQQHEANRAEFLRLNDRLQAVQARAQLLRAGGRDEAYTKEQIAGFLRELADEERQLHVDLFRLPESAKVPPAGRP